LKGASRVLTFGSTKLKITVTAQKGDGTIIITKEADINEVMGVIETYENARGTKISIQKLPALPIGPWDTIKPITYIRYKPEATIVGSDLQKR
jgi:hypothetical protein